MRSQPMNPFTSLNFNYLMIKKLLPIAIALLLFSCDKKFNEVGAEILPPSSIQGKKATYPVKVTHALVDVVQTNNLPVLQLGQRDDKLYGTTNAAIVAQMNLSGYAPKFGAYTYQQEIDSTFNEMETVTDAWLEIPFYTNQKDSDGDGLIDQFDIDDDDPNSDSDGDGVSDIAERNNGTDPTNPDTDGDGTPDGQDTETKNPNPDKKLYAIDSLFGNRQALFDVEVNKLNYFLRQLDPEKNFEQSQVYYSDFPIATHKAQQLGNANVQLDFNEIIVEGENNNLTPRLRVPLNKDNFQQLLINKEGATELSTAELWQDYFRSISIETSNFSAPLLMLLDVNKMAIRVAYSYKAKKADSTTGETEDKEGEFLLNVGLLKFNTLSQTVPADATLNAIVSATSIEQVALGGGLGSVATLSLFEDNEVLEDIKGRPWLLNEANLTFHVDKQAVNQFGLQLPKRLYVYNANTGTPLVDFSKDVSATTELNKLVYGGFLIEEEDKQYYKIRVTNHLRNIISNDSINAPLRVSLTNAFPTQTTVMMAKTTNTAIEKLPAGGISAPKSAVFVGPNPSDPALADLKLQLELYYTEVE